LEVSVHYQGNIIRPPSEAESILLQITLGCSHNKCTFCGTYQDLPFRFKNRDIISQDIVFASKNFPNHRHLFLCDGDALVLSQSKLTSILTEIQETLPNVRRVGLYATAQNIMAKSDEELSTLNQLGLGILYMGVESGSDPVLSKIVKGTDFQTLALAGQRVRKAGIRLSVTVLLGFNLMDSDHATATGKLLSVMNPDHIGVLSLMLIPGTELHRDWQQGVFKLPNSKEMLQELYIMLQNTQVRRSMFYTNHASNYLPLQIRLPSGKDEALQLISHALNGGAWLKPEWMRAL
jgi:radical SAM superfamily enzyme YgiQ (UPF0313 family)